MTEILAEVMGELESWMTETCSRSIYSDIEVRDRLLEVWISLSRYRDEVNLLAN